MTQNLPIRFHIFVIYAFKILVDKGSEIQSFENRTLQLETKPRNRISENSVQPQADEEKSPKEFPTAWITAPSQLNPDSNKIFNFSTNISDQKFGVTLDSAPRFLFGAPTFS